MMRGCLPCALVPLRLQLTVLILALHWSALLCTPHALRILSIRAKG